MKRGIRIINKILPTGKYLSFTDFIIKWIYGCKYGGIIRLPNRSKLKELHREAEEKFNRLHYGRYLNLLSDEEKKLSVDEFIKKYYEGKKVNGI